MDKHGPFQSFDDLSDAAQCAPRLAALRSELKRRGLDGFVIPHSDEHQSEYLPAHAERLAWLTAFTGSAGSAVVLMDRAVVFTDGRYTLQVRRQTDTSLFEPRDIVAEGPQGWIPDHLPRNAKLGYDPWLSTANAVAGLRRPYRNFTVENSREKIRVLSSHLRLAALMRSPGWLKMRVSRHINLGCRTTTSGASMNNRS